GAAGRRGRRTALGRRGRRGDRGGGRRAAGRRRRGDGGGAGGRRLRGGGRRGLVVGGRVRRVDARLAGDLREAGQHLVGRGGRGARQVGQEGDDRGVLGVHERGDPLARLGVAAAQQGGGTLVRLGVGLAEGAGGRRRVVVDRARLDDPVAGVGQQLVAPGGRVDEQRDPEVLEAELDGVERVAGEGLLGRERHAAGGQRHRGDPAHRGGPGGPAG